MHISVSAAMGATASSEEDAANNINKDVLVSFCWSPHAGFWLGSRSGVGRFNIARVQTATSTKVVGCSLARYILYRIYTEEYNNIV